MDTFGSRQSPADQSLADFRRWAISEDFPDRDRIDYLGGCIEVDMSPEDLHTHGKLKTELIVVLGQRIKDRGLGELYTDSTRVSCPDADLSKKDPKRDRRIEMEIVPDAYDAEERAMGWYCYLEEKLGFPFTAVCIAERAISPLHKGDQVEILEMGPEDECRHEMFVGVRWERRPLAVPLSQLTPVTRTDKQTKEAVADWHYWVAQGYEF